MRIEKIDQMELEYEGLSSELRHLSESRRELLWKIRDEQKRLAQQEDFEQHKRVIPIQRPNDRIRYPQNIDRDNITPIKQEITDLESQLATVEKRLAVVQDEARDLCTLLDRCKRYAGGPYDPQYDRGF